MATLLVLYHVPANRTAFDAYYAETHAPLAKQIPGLRSYSISAGPLGSPAGTPPYHLVAELTFDSMDAMQVGLASPQGQAAVADLGNFAQAGVTILSYETRPA